MDTLIGLAVFLPVAIGLYFGVRLIFEPDELQRFYKDILPCSLFAALIFWGTGHMDPSLDPGRKFMAALALTFFVCMLLRAFRGEQTRISLSAALSLTAAGWGIIIATAAVYLLSSLLPSSTFTPEISEDAREARATQARPAPLAPAGILRYTTGHEEQLIT